MTAPENRAPGGTRDSALTPLSTRAPLRVLEATTSAGSTPTAADDPPTATSPDLPTATSPGTDRERDTYLFLHGYGATSYMWRHWRGAFAARGRVLLVDMKGFGDAPKPDDGRYSPLDLADAVTDFIKEQDLGRLTLVGQSLGGGVALLTALRLHDEGRTSRGVSRLRRLILLAPAAYRQRLPPFVWLSHRPRLATALLRLVGARRVVRWTLRSVVYDRDSITDDQVEEYARPWRSRAGARAALAAGRQIMPPDIEALTARYPELKIPTLLLWGNTDRVVPLAIGRRLEEELPDARLVVLPSCGHVAPEERPGDSLDVVTRFLDEHPTR